jgi:hypothetical protein
MQQQGGNSDNPIPLQFCRGFQKLFHTNIVDHSLGNCLQDLDFTLVNSNCKPTSSSTKASPKPSPKPAPFKVEDMDYRLHEVETNLAGLNAITYVAGYLLKKFLEKHRCDIRAKCLVNLELDSLTKLFCYFTAYESSTKPFSWPTCSWSRFCIGENPSRRKKVRVSNPQTPPLDNTCSDYMIIRAWKLG